MTTESTESDRAQLARANLRSALLEAGVPAALAAHVAGTATVDALTGDGGALIQVGDVRAVDEPESLRELATRLVHGAPDDSDSDPTAGAEAARRAGKAAAEATKAAEAARALALR
jgi:hypothetical protein